MEHKGRMYQHADCCGKLCVLNGNVGNIQYNPCDMYGRRAIATADIRQYVLTITFTAHQ